MDGLPMEGLAREGLAMEGLLWKGCYGRASTEGLSIEELWKAMEVLAPAGCWTTQNRHLMVKKSNLLIWPEKEQIAIK